MTENEISKIVWDIAFQIHSRLGPGLFESVYEEIFAYELNKIGLSFERQKSIPLIWETIKLDAGFRADFIIENKVVVELKSVEAIHPVHQKQVLTYLKITNHKLGILINFNSNLIKEGFQRIVNKL
jgi:GxxExxY protein